MDDFEILKKIVKASIDNDKSIQESVNEISSSVPDTELISKARKIADSKGEFDVLLAFTLSIISERTATALGSELLAVIIFQIICNELEYWNSLSEASSDYDAEYIYVTSQLLPALQTKLTTFVSADNFLSDIDDELVQIITYCSAVNSLGWLETNDLLKFEISSVSEILNNNFSAVLKIYDKYMSFCNTCEKYAGPIVDLSKNAESSISLYNNLSLLCDIFGFNEILKDDDPVKNSQWYIKYFGPSTATLKASEFIEALADGNGDPFKKSLYYLIRLINKFKIDNDNYALNLSKEFTDLETHLVNAMYNSDFFFKSGLLKKKELSEYILQAQQFDVCNYDFSNYNNDMLNSNITSIAPILDKINHLDMNNFIDAGNITVNKTIINETDSELNRKAISDIDLIIFEMLCNDYSHVNDILDVLFNITKKTLRDVLFEYSLLRVIQLLNRTGVSISFMFEGYPIAPAKSIESAFTDKLKSILNLEKPQDNQNA